MDDNERDEAPADGPAYPSVEEMDALLPDFKVTEIIGQGGMGVVYRAWQERLERYVAIKVLPRVGDDEEEEFASQFKQEAKTMASLHHSHIVTVYDFGMADGLHYLIMEHVDGENLYEHFYDGAYKPRQVIEIILQICDGLSYAHTAGVIHRDIKSANILIGQDGMSKLVDFGLATLQEAPGVLRRRASSGTSYGTPGYSAPELFTFGSHVDHRADIYSLAVVVYEGLTGKTMDEAWTSPSGAAGAPSGIDQVLRKATKKDPKARYQSIELFAAALRQVRDTGPATTGVRKVAVTVAPATSTAVAAAIPVTSAGNKQRVVVAQQKSSITLFVVFGIIAAIFVLGAIILSSGGDPPSPPPKSKPEEFLSTVGEEKNMPPLPVPIPPEPSPGVGEPKIPLVNPFEPEVPIELPADVVAAEAALAAEMAEFDALFTSAYGKLVEKYVAALDRLRPDADVAGIAAIDADAAAVKRGDPPPAEDAPGLYAPLAKLRPVLRVENAKLVKLLSQPRIEVLEPHIESLKSIRAGLSDGSVGELVDAAIEAHRAKLAELKAAFDAPETLRGKKPAAVPEAEAAGP
ncbi:MAG: serine/threonine protein kinase [Verrucomicrobiales bacterium]|jgi:serine/threonine protein kinase